MLGIDPGSCGRAASSLNHSAISSPAVGYFSFPSLCVLMVFQLHGCFHYCVFLVCCVAFCFLFWSVILLRIKWVLGLLLFGLRTDGPVQLPPRKRGVDESFLQMAKRW